MADSNDAQENAFRLPSGSVRYRRAAISGGGFHIYFDRQPPASWPEHQHRQLQITVVFAGADCIAGWKTAGGRREKHRIVNKADQVLIVPAGRKHSFEWLTEAEILSFYLELDWARRFSAKDIEHISIEPLKSYIETAPIIGEIAAIFRRECAVDPQKVNEAAMETLGSALAAQLLIAEFAPYERNHPLRWTLPGPVLDRLRGHIEHNLNENLSLKVLARLASLSPSYFGQLFRASTGISPHMYVTQKRIARAKEMLATGNYRIAEVSDLVGFSDPHRMNYHFRRLLNTYPSAYLPRIDS